MGQLSFFAEFLEVSELFKDWCEGCPLSYTSPNAPEVVDVLGTWMLGILDGHHRYAHIAALRGDGLAPRILGMNKVIGDDSLRRALAQIAPAPNARHDSVTSLGLLVMSTSPPVMHSATNNKRTFKEFVSR